VWVNFALVLVKKKDNMKQCISNKGFEEAAVEVKERKREREREKKKLDTGHCEPQPYLSKLGEKKFNKCKNHKSK
jgi:hypothetical protein